MERISEESPWFTPYSNGASWKRPFTADDKLEDLQAVYKKNMEKALQQETDDLVKQELAKIKSEMIQSIRTLTRHGSTEGMRAARRILIAQPLAMVAFAAQDLIRTSNNSHLLYVVAHIWFEHCNRTDQFQGIDFGPEEKAVYGILKLDTIDAFRSWAVSWYCDLIDQLFLLKEYRAVTILHRYSFRNAFVRGGFLDSETGYDVLQYLTDRAVCSESECGVHELAMEICTEASRSEGMAPWIGTSGQPTPAVSDFDAVYSPRNNALLNENESLIQCTMCGRSSANPHWCKVCQEVPYCSRECGKEHWIEGGHRRVCCKEEKKRLVRDCVVCGKPSIVGCSLCIFTYYCSRDCQKKHWFEGGHKKACPRKPLPNPNL